jgi:hypothetical protein
MHTYLRGGVYVAEETTDEQAMQDALELLDPRLILTWELDRNHESRVWKVHVNWASDRPAIHVCDWRDERGRPLQLSSGLLEKVRHQLSLGESGLTAADVHNQKLVEEVDRDIDNALDDIADDMQHRLTAGHSAVLHRGVHLRRSRAKRATKNAAAAERAARRGGRFL